jgi:pimeloyl-ACP methyl ester carboxylesterase
MQTIYSSDRTRIAYQRSGQGSPLVLVHGTTADHTRWAPVLPMFERHYSVNAIDRRGRGGSGDNEQYTIEQEFDDVVAVIHSIDEPVFLLGHSYGAICCLEAALRTTYVKKLILYEPPIPTSIEIYPHEVVNRIQTLLDEGNREEALITFMRDIVHVPSYEMEILQSSPSWSARIAAAHTILRELRGSNEYVFEPERFTSLTTPTLLLQGGDSPPFFGAAIDAVQTALPESQVRIMPGQQHTAMNSASELFTHEVCKFLAMEE